MVFAPKESVESIGWEERQNVKSLSTGANSSAVKKKNGKKRAASKRSNETASSNNNAASSDGGSSQNKRSRDNNDAIVNDGADNSTSAATVSELKKKLYGEFQQFGPQLPSPSNARVNKSHSHSSSPSPTSSLVSANMSMNVLPPGVHVSQIKTGEDESSTSTFTTEVTFEDQISSIAIVGKAKLKAIEGSVEILGYRVHSHITDTGHNEVYLDSPNWMSCLCIEPFMDNGDSDGNDHNENSSKKVRIQISSLDEKEATFELLSPQLTRPVSMDDKWKNIASKIVNSISEENEETDKSTDIENERENSSPNHLNGGDKRVLVCGAKGVGKSTYVRYLANLYLSQNPGKEVAILDCDVGQPELSPPGMITLTILSKPLLSPPHVHMVCNHKDVFSVAETHHKAYFYGGTTSKNNPMTYVSSIGKLVKDYESSCQSKKSSSTSKSTTIPLIVNTDGYVKSMGYEILSSLIDIINPNHIAQIVGTSKAKFFDLRPHANPHREIHIAETKGTFPTVSQTATPTISRVTSLASMPSMSDLAGTNADSKGGQGGVENIAPIVSSLLRDLRLCVYFLGGYESFLDTKSSFDRGGISDDDCNIAMKLAAMQPYAVPYEAIQCILLDEDGNRCNNVSREDMYEELNASIVGLCDKSNSCHGLGIVRGVDRVRKMLYILTPTHPDILCSHVVSAVRGQLQLPSACTYRGVYMESFPFICCDGVSVGIGSDTMKGKDR